MQEQSLTWLAYASVALLAIGALAWAGHLYARADDPATFASGGLPAMPLIIYFVLTPTGLAGIGIILLRGCLRRDLTGRAGSQLLPPG